MSAFILRRVLLAIPTLFGVLVVAFLVLQVAPGDPVQAMVGERADSATVARLRAQLNLDEPLVKRFALYAGSIAKGDLGRSYITDRPIMRDIRERFPKTLQLAGAAMLLAAFFGITLGILSAAKPGGFADRFALGLAYIGISFPVYWVGLLFILLFAVQLHWLPPSGFGGLKFLILPAVTLGMRSIAFLARMTRSAMLDALSSDYIRTARAKGLGTGMITLRHGFRNALIPVITVLGLDFGAYLTGSILTETIFGWPGIGRYVVNAIARRDLPAIQGSVLFLSAVFVLVNLITDLAYAKADPRVRLS
ncbi:MAG TPA: ABC transporter permease [Gemmatimonadaceae bacterium]|nr:ABC transporter permease [Gemmatimonadaceae bacterium]